MKTSELIAALRKAVAILSRPKWAASGIDLDPVAGTIREIQDTLRAAEAAHGT